LLAVASVSDWIHLCQDIEPRYTFVGGNNMSGIKDIPPGELVGLQFEHPSI